MRSAAQGLLTTALLAALGPDPLVARVEVKTRADGRKLIYNESSSHYANRTAATLRPAPSSELTRLIGHNAQQQGLDPQLVQAVIQVESGYNSWARSRKGAIGLMQLMPETARQLGVADPYDPGQNIRGGTSYLRRQLDRFSGDLDLALAAYNAGPEAVSRYGGIPPFAETRDYVRKVLHLYRSAPRAAPYDPAADALRRQRSAAGSRSPAPVRRGRKIQLSRGAAGRIVVTNTPPKYP